MVCQPLSVQGSGPMSLGGSKGGGGCGIWGGGIEGSGGGTFGWSKRIIISLCFKRVLDEEVEGR